MVKMSAFTSYFRRRHTKLTLAEASGALGDLGTFLPLVVGLVKVAGLDLGTTLLFTGVYNVITGIMFDIPMPVQPMKTIAAVALAETGSLSIPQIMAAGIFVSSCVLFLGASGMMGLATRIIPGAVIRGMQLGLGLNLALKGFQQVWYATGKPPLTRPWFEVDGRFLGVAAVAFTLLTVYPREKSNRSSGSSSSSCDESDGGEDASIKTSKSSHDDVVEGGGAWQATTAKDQATESTTQTSNTHNLHSISLSPSPPLEIREASTILIALPTTTTTTTTNANNSKAAKLSSAAHRTISFILKPVYAMGDAANNACGGTERSALPPLGKAVAGIPAALVLVILGIILTLATQPSILSSLSLGPSTPQIVVPSASDWRTGILRAGLPQLSLTVFNSIISVCQLSAQLFPDRPASPGHVATSVGLMNLVGCWFGAMPSCHGAGGLAAQTRFGARSGVAPIFLGVVKIFLALLLGSSLFELLQAFPSALLGAMLVVAGIELATVGLAQRTQRGIAVMLFTAATTLALNNVAEGVVAGLLIAYALALRDFVVDICVESWNKRHVASNTDSLSVPPAF